MLIPNQHESSHMQWNADLVILVDDINKMTIFFIPHCKKDEKKIDHINSILLKFKLKK